MVSFEVIYFLGTIEGFQLGSAYGEPHIYAAIVCFDCGGA
jgi:hypothetical protein